MNKNLIKKLYLIPLITLLVTLSVSGSTIDFSKNEAYYQDLCFNSTAQSNVAVCKEYQAYINKKAKDAKAELDAIRSDLKNIKTNILKYAQEIETYEKQIESLEKDIAILSASIYRMEANVRILEDQIFQREVAVEVRDEAIKERIVMMQGFYTVNGYVDFILGASSFTDLIRRVEGIHDITSSDRNQIRELRIEIEKIEIEKAEVERQKSVLDDNRVNLVMNLETAEGIKEAIEEIIVEFQKQEAELISLEDQYLADIKEVQDQLKKISEALNAIMPSPGWVRPISSGFRISSGVWYYNSGGIHLGTDFSASVGTAVRAVANGVVIFSSDSCPTYGFLGNTYRFPGSAMGGNQVYLVAQVNDRAYAIRYIHLQSGTPTKSGTIVNQGDIVGRVGSSGNSSGPHLHIEVIYLGINSVKYYADRWNGDFAFGAGWGSTALDRRCSVNGNRPPCRLSPQSVFGVVVGQSY